MTWMIYFCLALVGYINPAKAEFYLDKDYCYISTEFEFTHNENKVMGLFQLAFNSPPVTLPIMNISFSGDFKPEEVSVSWRSAKLTNRSGQALFDQSFTQALNSSEKVFPFYRNGGEVYYSPAYGFLNSRIFISMLLSQNIMEMNYKETKSSAEQRVDISLAGSDLSFRQLSVSCYKEKVSEYLNEHGTRKKPLAESWSNGYGMLNYPVADNLQESSYLLQDGIRTDIAKTYEFYSGLYPLLEKKSEILSQISEVENKSSAAVSLSKIKEIQELATVKRNRLKELDSEDRTGLIQKTQEKIQDLNLKIKDLEIEIKELKDVKLKQAKAEVDTLSASNEILVSQLQEIDSKILTTENRLQDSSAQLDQLYESYIYIGSKISEAEISRLQAMEKSSIPYSYEAIQENLNKISEKEIEILTLKGALDEIRLLEPQIKNSVEKYQQALSAYKSLLQVQKDMAAKKAAISEQQILKQKKQNELEISLQDLVNTNKKIESSLKKDRSLEDEKAEIIASLRSSNADFDSIVEKLASSDLLVMQQVVCRSNIFRADATDYCLKASELDSEAEIRHFLENMDSKQMDDLIIKSQIDYSYPWRHPDGKTKIEVLTERLSQEFKSPLFSELKQSWRVIIAYRWRYNQVRNLTDNTVNSKTYENAIKSYREELERLNNLVRKLSDELGQMQAPLQSAQMKYLKDEADYHQVADVFALNFKQTMQSLGDMESAKSCGLSFFDVLSCQQEFSLYVNQKQTELNAKEVSYTQEVERVALEVLSGIEKVSEIKSESQSQKTNLAQERTNFLATTQIEALLLEQEKLQAEHSKLLVDLQTLEAAKIKNDNDKELQLQEEERFKQEMALLTTELISLEKQASDLASGLEQFCQEQGGLYTEIEAINANILKLGGVLKDIESQISPCQSLKSMVLR